MPSLKTPRFGRELAREAGADGGRGGLPRLPRWLVPERGGEASEGTYSDPALASEREGEGEEAGANSLR